MDPEPVKLLAAHSGYWTAREFVRFGVVETGRLPGRENTFDGMRAVGRYGEGTDRGR